MSCAPPRPTEIVVVSYRKDYRIVHHGDWHASYEGDSNMEIFAVSSEEAAADRIVTAICADPRASYKHLLFTSWRGVVSAGDDSVSATPATEDYSWRWNKHGQGIWAPYWVDYDRADWEEQEIQEAEVNAIASRVRSLVEERLAKVNAKTLTRR